MPGLIDTVYNVITPILLAMGLGVLFGHYARPDPKILSGVAIYIFAPCLVLEGMTNAEINGDALLQIGALVVLASGAMTLIGWALARSLGLRGQQVSAFMLTVVLFNGATYGIPFNKFAFADNSEQAEQLAIVYFSVMVIVTNTLGVYLASRGTGISPRAGIINIIRLPSLYAIFIGLAFNLNHVALLTTPDGTISGRAVPLPLARTVDLLGAASIPLMLVLLGIQLERSHFSAKRLTPALVASGTTLFIAPLVAGLLALVIGVDGLSRQVGIMQFAMPTAILAGVFATEFGGDAEFVTSVILISTLTSVLTLSVVLQFV